MDCPTKFKIKNVSFSFFFSSSFWVSQNVIAGEILFAHINTPRANICFHAEFHGRAMCVMVRIGAICKICVANLQWWLQFILF